MTSALSVATIRSEPGSILASLQFASSLKKLASTWQRRSSIASQLPGRMRNALRFRPNSSREIPVGQSLRRSTASRSDVIELRPALFVKQAAGRPSAAAAIKRFFNLFQRLAFCLRQKVCGRDKVQRRTCRPEQEHCVIAKAAHHRKKQRRNQRRRTLIQEESDAHPLRANPAWH